MVSKKERSKIGRQMAALRKVVKKPCPVCGRPMAGIKNRRYCSAACRQKAFRERRAKG